MVEEKIYTVPLRRGFLKVAKYDRTRKAMTTLKQYLKKHLKKDVKIGKYLNLEIWKYGRKNPPSKIKIRVEEEKENLIAELINAPREKKVEEKKEKKAKVSEKIEDEEKEKTKKAITDVPEKEIKEEKEIKIAEKKHAHRKEEEVITKTGQTKSRTS